MADNPQSQDLIREFWAAGKPVAAVCAGTAALTNLTLQPSGEKLLHGKHVTGLSKAELALLPGFTELMPFMLEDRMRGEAVEYTVADEPWGPHVVVDGKLITGQNPASAAGVGEALVKLLG